MRRNLLLLVGSFMEMPECDGFELTEAIRTQPSLAGVPVVILTSRGDEADRRRGLEAGADAAAEGDGP